MAVLQILTLGPLQIAIDDAPVSGFLSNKVRALLLYLAIEQARPFRREQLANLLWPGQSHRKARANLRRALANLRQVIDDENGRFLHVTRQTLQFNPASSAHVDAVQFEQLLNQPEPTLTDLETAVSLAHGRFLDDFSINNNIAFEEWALLKREQLQRQLLHTLHQLATHYESQHQPKTAVRYAWKMVQTEPWYESGQRQLLRLLAQTGQRGKALAHYGQFENELLTELDVLPEPATRRLYAQIRGDANQSANIYPPFFSQPAATPPTFVAREPELAQLNAFLQTAVSSKAHFAFISGEAGSGKTSLLRTFSWQAQQQQPMLIPLMGSSPAHIGPGNPYQPIRTLLTHSLGDLEPAWRDGSLNPAQAKRLWSLRQTVLNLLQQCAPDCLTTLVDPAHLPEEQRETAVAQAPPQEILFEQLVSFLRKLSQQGPLLLMLEDLHWADSGTLDLLFFLRRELVGYPMLLVGSYRPEALHIANGQHALTRLIYELTHDFGQIELALNQVDGRLFIDAWLDKEPNQLGNSFRDTLLAKTRGHALFTIELVKSLKVRGDLYQNSDGCWRASKNVSWGHLPAKTEGIIAKRIEHLPTRLRQLLSVASTQGETFAAEIVARVGQYSYSDTLRAFSANLSRQHDLIQPLGRQSVVGQTVSYYRFRHSLFQEYVYGRLDANERAHLHQRTGESMEELFETAVSQPSPIAADLAYHFEAAQLTSQAITYHQLAGQHALRLSAHLDASNHYQHSLVLLNSLPHSDNRIHEEITCQLVLGASLLAINGYTNAEVKAAYDRAYELCLQIEAAPEMVTSLFWLTSYYAVSGNLAKAVTVSEQMLAVVEQFPVSDMHRMQAHVLAGLPHFFMGRNRIALTHFRQACAIYDPPVHQPLVYTFGQDPGIAAMMWQGHVLFHQGCFAEATACVQQALVWADELDHPYTKTFIELLAGYSPNGYYLRQATAAKAHAETAVSLAKKHHFQYLLALSQFYLGFETAVSQPQPNAQPNDGFTQMEEAMAMETAVGARLGLSSRYLNLANAYRQHNQLEKAWQAIHQARTEAYSRLETYFASEIERVSGELHLLAGDTEQAEICLHKAIQLARQQEATAWELKAATSLGRLWHEQGKTEPASSIVAQILAKIEPEPHSPDVAAAKTLLCNLVE
ncbi:AAA family ATPase [Candidatus Leptofilum sp.]|uniref:AAA family ATPase n=1 Tax=Candidatus Leptofilum sp. TaxID=3241576 RepID=UPI003B5AB028